MSVSHFQVISGICALILVEAHGYTKEEVEDISNPVLELKALDKDMWKDVLATVNTSRPVAKRYTVNTDGTICWL